MRPSVFETLCLPNMHFSRPTGGVCLAALVLSVQCADAVIPTTTSFTSIPNAVFVNVPGSSTLSPLTSGSVTITPNLVDMSGSYVQFSTPGLASDPADGYGFTASTQAPWSVGDLTLNFNTPVAAFGVTFLHFEPTILAGWGMNLPASLQAFDGPNGTGNLLGSVTSSGFVGNLQYNFDFVGLLSTSRNIRSVIIGGASAPKGYGVDGYAYSLTAVPEPSAASVLCLGLATLVCAGRGRAGGTRKYAK